MILIIAQTENTIKELCTEYYDTKISRYWNTKILFGFVFCSVNGIDEILKF